MEEQEDIRGWVSSILDIAPESESGLLDLTSFLDRDAFVGAGGFGEVYRTKWLNKVSTEQVQLLPRLSIKVMHAVPLKDEVKKKKREKYLKREIRLLRDLLHPNIVPLIGYVLLENDSNRPCLISLFVSNGNVREYSIGCSMIRLCELMLGIANGLYYLHAHNIIHGDVKSGNVLVNDRGIAKLIDFGLSRLMEDSLSWQSSTKDGAPGSIRWQAPELMNGSQKEVTPEGDIYAFGMTCWEILKGQLPFTELRRDAEVFFAVLNRKQRPRRPQRRDLPDELWHVIEACWLEDPTMRPAFGSTLLVITELFHPENYMYRRRYVPKIYDASNPKLSDDIIMNYPESGQWSESELWEKRESLCKDGGREALVAVGELAWARGNQGLWDEARVLEENLVPAWAKLDGEDSRSAQLARGNLASTYARLEYFEEAESVQLSLLQVWGHEIGKDALRAMASLACTNIFRKRYDKAEKLLMEAKDGMMTIFGENHPDTIASMHDLAVVYTSQGRLEAAEELFRKVIEARESVIGENHPETLMSIHNLALTYCNQKRWKEAEELQVKALEARTRVLGENHPDTLLTMHNLALTYYSQKRWKEAEELEGKTLEARKRVLGENHPNTLQTMHNLASTYYSQNRWKEAEELHVKTLEARKRVLRENHPDTLETMHNLALTYYSQKRWKEAEELNVKTLEARKRVLRENHPDTLLTMHSLASTYYRQKRWKEAEELHVKTLEARKRVLGENHRDTLATMHTLASTYRKLNRWKEAEELLVKVIKGRRRNLGENHAKTLKSIKQLDAVHSEQNRLMTE